MSLYAYDLKEYQTKQTLLHTLSMSRLERKVKTLFRVYASDVVSAYRAMGIPIFPSEFNDNLAKVLYKEYIKISDVFSSFNREYLTLSLANQLQIEANIERVLDDRLPPMSQTQAALITTTTQKQLARTIERARESIDTKPSAEASYIHQELTARVSGRSMAIAATEVTRVAELSKQTEVESTLEGMTEDEVLEAYGDELTEEDKANLQAGGVGVLLASGVLAPRAVWNATLDGVTRISHAAAHGQPMDRNGSFSVGDEFLRYPGDQAGSPNNTINCRCFLVYEA